MYMSRLKLHRKPILKTLTSRIKKIPKTITLLKKSRKENLSLATSWRRRMMQSLPTTSATWWKDRLRDNSNSLLRSRFSRVWLKINRRLLVKTKRRLIRNKINYKARYQSECNQTRKCMSVAAMPHQWWYLLLILPLIIRSTRTNQAMQTKAYRIEACASNRAISQLTSKSF